MIGRTPPLARQIEEIEQSLQGSSEMARQFQAELAAMRAAMLSTNREAQGLGRALGQGLQGALRDVVVDGAKISDALRAMSQGVIDAAYRGAMRPVQSAIGGALQTGIGALVQGIMPFAKGGVFSGAQARAFAKGGVVGGPAIFGMEGGGLGLMGEAGPEAIMPLSRGPDGRLGIASAPQGRAISVTMNITTPDVAGFRQSQSQIAARLSRALALGQRNR